MIIIIIIIIMTIIIIIITTIIIINISLENRKPEIFRMCKKKFSEMKLVKLSKNLAHNLKVTKNVNFLGVT